MLKLKLNIQKINIYFRALTVIATIAAIAIISLFLYKNFYQTITQSEEIIILRQKVAPLTINMDKFNKIMEKIEEKNTVHKIGAIRNPFSFGARNKQIPNTDNEVDYKASGQNNIPAIPQFQ